MGSHKRVDIQTTGRGATGGASENVAGLLLAIEGLHLTRSAVWTGPDGAHTRQVLGEALSALRRALATRTMIDDDDLVELAEERPALRKRVIRLRSAIADVLRRLDGILWRFAEEAPLPDLVTATIGIVAAIRTREEEVSDLLR